MGLLSFHRNGYVRQEAVRLLAHERSGDELRFLLIRQNDWVDVIGVEAQEAVSDRLVPAYLPHFVRCFPLVIHLLAFRRRDLSSVVRMVVEMLVRPEHDALLDEVMGSSNTSVSRQIVRTALDLQGEEHHARVIRRGLASSDPMVRLMCAKRVCRSLKGQEFIHVTGSLQQDRFMPVRREGFLAEAENHPDTALNAWRRALLDRHASIRELARYSIGKMGDIDAAAYYRQNLAVQGRSLPAVNGLAECGDLTDLTTLRGFLIHSRSKVRRAAVRGIARIAKEAAIDDLVRTLTDGNANVVREAQRQLEPLLADVRGEALFAVVSDADTEYARKCAIELIGNKGKWQSLPWLIRAASHPDEATASLARRFIEAWFSPPLCNTVFTKPSAAEREALGEAMDEARPYQSEEFLERLRQWLPDRVIK